MRTFILGGVAALALAAMPAIAQDTSADADGPATTQALPPDQAPPDQPAPDQAAPPPQSADQANADAQPAPPTTTVEPAASGAGTVITTYPGNDSGPPASALNKTYPVCSRTIQDECQNPGEGGAPGRSRALKYWPGKPASEGGR